MNKIFKVKFNFTNNTSVVTSELAKSRGKSRVAKVAVASLVATLGVAATAFAEPDNEITQAAGYTASKVITLTTEASAERESGVVYNADTPDSVTETNLFHDANIDVTGKYTYNQSAIAVGGKEDNDKKKATLSLKEVSLNLTEDVKDIARKPFDFNNLPPAILNMAKLMAGGDPSFDPSKLAEKLAALGMNFEQPAEEKTKRYFVGAQATYGGALYADKLSVVFNPKEIDKAQFTLFTGKLEVPKNASLIGLLAGTAGVGHSSEASSGLVNKIVIGGDYNFESKRAFTEADIDNPQKRALYPEVYGLQAVQNNDFYSGGGFNFLAPSAKQPTGKAPQALITVKGKYTADIENAIGFGLTVSGKINDEPMPTVNLADTDIKLNSITGSGIRVGADWHKGRLSVSRITGAGTNVNAIEDLVDGDFSLGDGSGAGTLNFAEGSTVNVTATHDNYRDAAVSVSYGESVLDASKAKSFTVTSSGTSALRIGDVIKDEVKDTGKEITVKINNANISLTDKDVELESQGPLTTIHSSPNPTETAVLDFTSDDKSSIKAHKKGFLVVTTMGNTKLNFAGNGPENSVMEGALFQGEHVQGGEHLIWPSAEEIKAQVLASKPNATEEEIATIVAAVHAGNGGVGGMQFRPRKVSVVKDIKVSKLDTVVDNATWLLGPKDGSALTNSTDGIKLHDSTLASLTLKNGAVLDAALDDPSVITAEKVYSIALSTAKVIDDPNLQGSKTTTLDEIGTFTNDNSVIDLANNGKVGDKLNILGKYVGNNGTLKVNTIWNRNFDSADKTSSSSDVLDILGTATGTTKVVPVSAAGVENFIDGDIVEAEEIAVSAPTIFVSEGADAAGAFTGEASTQNITSVQLTSELGEDGKARRFFWTTKAKDKDGSSHEIVDQTVPAYALNHQANAELGQLTLGTLIERRGEQSKQAWVRLLGKKYKQETSGRFSHNAHLEGIQIHYDFNKSVNDEYNAYSAVFFTYGQSKAKFEDKYRAKDGLVIADKNTGSAKASSIGIGASHTIYANTGIYLDSVFHVAKLKNKFTSESGLAATQKGTSFALSLEAGKSFTKDKWRIEPQAQLTYQFTKYNEFTDGAHVVDAYKAHDVRARLGSRFTYDFDKSKSAYVVVNLVRKLTPAPSVSIGNDVVDYNVSRTIGELGLGGQIAVGKNISVYSDVRLEKGFDGLNYGAYRGNLGLKYSW